MCVSVRLQTATGSGCVGDVVARSWSRDDGDDVTRSRDHGGAGVRRPRVYDWNTKRHFYPDIVDLQPDWCRDVNATFFHVFYLFFFKFKHQRQRAQATYVTVDSSTVNIHMLDYETR